MHLQQLHDDQQYCLRIATEALGEQVRAVVIDSDIESAVFKRLRREARRGLDGAQPVVRFVNERRGHILELGVETYCCSLDDRRIRLAKIIAPRHCYATDACYEFWAVPDKDYRAFYRFLRSLMRRQQQHEPPLLRPHEIERLWKNTIGFLRHGREMLKRYGVPQRRGVLLLGEPGNGKTMACRWLRAQCNRYRLDWAAVTAEEFETARADGEAHRLFQLQRPGILLFDDIDLGVQRARDEPHSGTQSTVLCGLDGLDTHAGVVYLFTSNVRAEDLDPAFRRPGRIDVIMQFPRPDATLRQRLIEDHWRCEIAEAIDVARAVTDTEGLSFAELEEVKKLLVLSFLETGQWEWPRAWESFQQGRAKPTERKSIGFSRDQSWKARRATSHIL